MNIKKINKNKIKYLVFFIISLSIFLFLINNYFLDNNDIKCHIVDNLKVCYTINLFKN